MAKRKGKRERKREREGESKIDGQKKLTSIIYTGFFFILE